ncbi:MAG: 50S ribosomal protein L23 [archaeon]
MSSEEPATESPKGVKRAKQARSERKLPTGFKPEEILLYPSSTEKSVRGSAENVMTFIVPRKASKPSIKLAAEALYGVKVLKVRTENSFSSGKKKAFLRLGPESSATELASKLGML